MSFVTYDTQRIINNNAKHNLTKESTRQVQEDKLVVTVDQGLLNSVLEILCREFKLQTTEDRGVKISRK